MRGTLQDRLTKALRPAGLTTLETANAYLPGFLARCSERFAHAPQDPQSAPVPLPEDLDTNYYSARWRATANQNARSHRRKCRLAYG